MKPDLFLQNFEQLANAPNGIQKLRELILQLAVQGKLVEQDPKDEPAAVLLKKIEAETQKSISPVDLDAVMYDLPSGWQWVRLGNIAQHNAGKTLDKGRNKGVLRDYITTSNLYWGFFLLDDIRQMPIEDSELDKCTAQKGDLLVCEGGEAGRAAVWESNDTICFQNHIHRVRFFGGINAYYAFRLFEKMFHTGEINRYRKGVAITSISGKALASIIFPLPPLAEQKRIVARVEQLMARCDELEALQKKRGEARITLTKSCLNQLTLPEQSAPRSAWRRVADNFDLLIDTPESVSELRKTILQLAVQGKLVEQDPEDEPAEVLLEKISGEKQRLLKEGKIRKIEQQPLILDDETPFALPKCWEWVRLGETTINVEYGTSHKASPMRIGIPVLRMNNIQDGQVVLDNLKYVPKNIEELPKLFLENGDILFNRTNSAELVGKAGVFKGPGNAFTFASYLIRVALFEDLLISDYVNLVINSSYFRTTQIIPELTQQCGQANFNGTKLKNSLVPLPPLAEQKRIVAKVDLLMKLCDALESKLAQSQADADKLLSAIVHSLTEAAA